MKKIILIVLLIIIVLVVSSLVLIKLIKRPEIEKPKEKWPLGEIFPREPTLEDLLPTLDSKAAWFKTAGETEDWWYGAILNGNDDKTYGFVSSGAYVWFSKIKEEGPEPTEILSDIKNFNYQRDSDSIELSFSGTKGNAQVTIKPESSHLVIDVYDRYKLDLNFKSRGIPYWYGNGFGALVDGWIVNGYEDISTVEGTAEYNGNTISLNGRGVFERARWGYPIGLTASDWYPINFDQGYALIFQGRGKLGSIYKDAIVSIGKDYSYVGDKNKVNVELLDLDANKVPRRTHITVDTSYGKFETLGIFIGHMQAGIIRPSYNFTGTFTYKNGTVLTLTGGNGFDAYRPW